MGVSDGTLHVLVPFAAAVVAGAINSAAGGGSFVSFPALLLVGFPPIAANATNNTAMWIGNIGSISGYREEFDVERRALIPPVAVATLGGLAGSILLLRTPESAFARAVPFLLAFATLVFAVSPRLRRAGAVRARSRPHLTLAALFAVSVYGGYFGAGIGIMMLALFAATSTMSVPRMNAMKNVLSFFINGIAVLPFAIARAVVWPEALVMAVGAAAGAYAGARIIRRLPPPVTRGLVVALGTVMTVVLFLRR